MNVAGRKMVGSISTPVRPGSRSSSAASTLRVTSSVLPSGCFSTISSRPGPSLMTASPIGGGEPIATSATSPSRTGALAAEVDHGARPGRPASRPASRWRTASRWFGVSTNPPAPATVASLRGPHHRVERDAARPAAGRDRPAPGTACRAGPRSATFATPGTDISFGRIVHSARTVRSSCESVFDETPIFITRLVDDSGCRMTGGRATAGSRTRLGREPLLHELPDLVDVGPFLEDQHHRRQPEHRLRADRLDAGSAVEGVLQRHADQALDLLGRQAGGLGLDLDHRRGELGEHVERGGADGAERRSDEQAAQGEDDDPAADGGRDQPAEHARPHLMKPVSAPNSSCTPGGHDLSSRPAARSPAPASRPDACTRRRPGGGRSVRGPVCSYTQVPPWMSNTTADHGTVRLSFGVGERDRDAEPLAGVSFPSAFGSS